MNYEHANSVVNAHVSGLFSGASISECTFNIISSLQAIKITTITTQPQAKGEESSQAMTLIPIK